MKDENETKKKKVDVRKHVDTSSNWKHDKMRNEDNDESYLS